MRHTDTWVYRHWDTAPETHRHLDVQKHGDTVTRAPRHWGTRYTDTETNNHWDLQTLRHTNTDT